MSIWLFEFTADTLIAGLALLVAGWSGWTAHRAYKLAKGATAPAVSVTIDRAKDHPGWWIVGVIITNPSSHLLKAERIRVILPRGTRLLSWFTASKPDGFGNQILKSELPLSSSKRSIGLSIDFARVDPRDTLRDNVLLYVPPTKQHRIWLHLTLVMMDAANTRKSVLIRRSLEKVHCSASQTNPTVSS